MVEAEVAGNEFDRLVTLWFSGLLDTDSDLVLDGLTELAAGAVSAPIALVSLVDADRQWFKSRHGLEATETSRAVSFCAHAILEDDSPLVVEDARTDVRFHDNPLVVGQPHIRFYAGFPLRVREGHRLGTLCVIDSMPRRLQPQQRVALLDVSRRVEDHLEQAITR